MSAKKAKKPMTDAKKKRRQSGNRSILVTLALAVSVSVAYIFYSINSPLDRINSYEVHVAPQKDGTMLIDYSLEWEVLDDEQEGPLTWVKIGTANAAYELVDFGGDIKNERRGNGAYVQFDLNKAFYEGDIAEFHYTILQRSMLCSNEEDAALPFYDFTPGWFGSIEIQHYRFTWEDSPFVKRNNADRVEGGNLIWEGGMGTDFKRQMQVYYREAMFVDPKLVTWQPMSGGDSSDGANIDYEPLLFIWIVAGVSVMTMFQSSGLYMRGRGYGGRGGGRRSGGGGCACACAGCACACACAGGGRAGCTTKDFYGKNPYDKICRAVADEV